MLDSIDNWKYKNKAAVMSLSDAELISEAQELFEAISQFSKFRVPLTDEMFWLLMTIVSVGDGRGISLPD